MSLADNEILLSLDGEAEPHSKRGSCNLPQGSPKRLYV